MLLLSHMRGHVADMGRVVDLGARHGLALVEDCAHTMGAGWDGWPTGTFGAVGCFSLQSYKHANAGEGGLLVTDDDDIAARAKQRASRNPDLYPRYALERDLWVPATPTPGAAPWRRPGLHRSVHNALRASQELAADNGLQELPGRTPMLRTNSGQRRNSAAIWLASASVERMSTLAPSAR